MILSRYTLKNIPGDVASVPDEAIFELPEKVLQFGTGVLLRGLPDYFIDKANRAGLFNGRVVVVKSTTHGDTRDFDRQDGLYTLCIRGFEDGRKVDELQVNASISRVLSAGEQWEEILECAHNADMQIIISNTTEVGIELVQDDIRHHPPKSFPGKLLAFLYERFRAFEGSAVSGMVIVPTELIPDNGSKLQSIVLELAHLNGLEDTFIEWLETNNHFCNSLVDRIVPGRPEAADSAQLQEATGYSDKLLTVAEVYRLWAIEGDEHVRSVLSFSGADAGVVITPDIGVYRELKLRVLNGTHTLSCGLAFLAGCETVKEAMDDEAVATFIADLMQVEIAPAIPYNLDPALAADFGRKVLDRFANPFLKHQWLSITMNYSSKMKMRCLPLLREHYRRQGSVPELMTLGFAAYLRFMKAVELIDGKYYGELAGERYHIQDDQAPVFFRRWAGLSVPALVRDVLRDSFWGVSLYDLPGFADAVTDKLNSILHNGVRESLEAQPIKKVNVA
ncbi:tagaturonate reductase [Flaviaesturariibacter aridisoli]|uniref:Tagaturonate reductase n=1 Tax=Flaviaesturariibacter aridisoli TaxID=2545761 RepID=A0A4R4E6U3_9BACT|nr:tagaturonate reductase [Flaviaesturariibacter aridisoli]TCZ73438.1 tagaturonate reductase [Flaviaesturariibacter aridisoli]